MSIWEQFEIVKPFKLALLCVIKTVSIKWWAKILPNACIIIIMETFQLYQHISKIGIIILEVLTMTNSGHIMISKCEF